MALNLSDYLKMLTEPSYRPKARLTFLRMEDESPYDIITGDILDGNIQITRNNGVRRSCSLTLKNDDGKYIPNPYNIWVNRKFFLELGLEKETYVDQTVWENDTAGEETKEAGRFDNTITELQEGTLTNVFVDSNGLQLVANEPTGNRISPSVSLSEIKNVDSSLIEWVATTPQGTVGEEVLTQSNFEEGTLTDVAYDTDGIKLNLPITEGNWLSPTLDLSPIKKAISSGISWEADEQEQLFDYIEDSPADFATGTLTYVAVGAEGLELAQANGALSFDGVDDYVTMGSDTIIQSSSTSSASYEAWFNYQGQGAGSDKRAFVLESSDYRFSCYVDTNGEICVRFSTTESNSVISTGFFPELNKWYHVAVVWDGSITKVYVDGQEVFSRSQGGSISSVRSLRIGTYRDNDNRWWKGHIYNVRIWNVARTQGEIQVDMHRELMGTEPGLVGYWRFDEGAGTTAIDSSPNGNNGTIVGATYTEDVPFEYYAPTGNRLTTLSLDTIKDVTGSSVNWTSTTHSTNNTINETEISTGIFDQTEHNLGVITLQYDTTWDILSGLTWEEV